MSNKGCIAIPGVTTPYGVEPSRLFKDLVSKNGLRIPRSLATRLYASYLNSNIEASMEAVLNPDGSPKYQRNRQGQFNAKDVVEFLNFDKALSEISNYSEEAYRLGATESLGGKAVDYTNAEDVLRKVNDFNNTHDGLVAYVIERYDPSNTIYNIAVYEKNANNTGLEIDTRERLQAWDIYKQVFNAVGVDITSMPTELANIFSAYNVDLDLILKNLTTTNISDMYKRDALILFSIDSDSIEVKRLINSFGSIENAAQTLGEINQGYNNTATNAQKTLLQRAINHAKKLHGIDIDALVSQINNLKRTERISSPEAKLKETIHKLKKKYKIDIDEVIRTNDRIKNLSDANVEAALQLKRRISELNKERGKNAEGTRLELLYNKLIQELNVRHYYSGIIDYLSEAGKSLVEMDDILNNIPQTGTEKERVFNTIKALQNIKNIRNQYWNIISSLAYDNVTMDEAISQKDIDNIKKRARALTELFNKKKEVTDELEKKAIHDFMKVATNDKLSESDINDVLERALKEVSWADKFLYSIGTANNILLAASGTIMRNQEIKRDQALTDFKKKVDRATDKLYKAGYDSKFMYEDPLHIISDIDWNKYNAARDAKKASLKNFGLSGFKLKQALEDWEDQNTEDRIVDKKNNRVERVPNQNYRKQQDFQEDWSQAQKEYYETMMELKGEVESYYPDYARNYYLPPQTRRNTVDALLNAKNVKDVGKAIKRKAEDIIKVREDDTDFTDNAIVNGEVTEFTEGDFDNTPKREVPIFYQNKVEEGELLLDFSAGLMRYASSAINYDAMNEIRDVMEFMKGYADSKNSALPKSKSEVIGNRFSRGIKELYNYTKTNNVGTILGAFMDQHLYGIKKNPNEPKWLTKLCDSIIRYTSFKGLVFNAPGAMANALMGFAQIIIDAGGGEFFNKTDAMWAFTKLFGDTGATGEIMELLTNNVNHKGTLFTELFDPEQKSFEDNRDKRYYTSIIRRLIGHDCQYIGYGAGEYFIHLLPMYAILNHQKVLLNGEKISLYDAFEVTPQKDGNSELKLRNGVTDLDGNPITSQYIDKIKGRIRYVNQSLHGAMNAEDKGLIHQYCLGRLVMNFRQWAVAHYSRRYRGRHWDFNLQDWREGYYTSLYKGVINADVKEVWNMGHHKDAMLIAIKDFATFIGRSSTQWKNLNDMQRYNIKRARTEILTLISLIGLSFALGDPDEHKKEFWRRWWIYQNKRMIMETSASIPWITMITNFNTMANSPMAGINTFNSMLYVLYGLPDIMEEIESGPHKGENKYWRNVIKYDLPFFKDWEKIQAMDEDDSLFKVFDTSPSNH